jgi:IS5 family transposase
MAWTSTKKFREASQKKTCICGFANERFWV